MSWPGLPILSRISATLTTAKRKTRRGSRGGKTKEAKKAKEAKEAKEVSRGTQSDLDIAPGTSALGTDPRLAFIVELLTGEEAELNALPSAIQSVSLAHSFYPGEPHKEGGPGQQLQQEPGVVFHMSDEERRWGR